MRFEKVKLPDGNVIIDTRLPQRGLKPAGLEMHTHMLKTLFSALEKPENMENGVVKMMSVFIANTILDMAKRDETLENIERIIKEEMGEDGGALLNFNERMRIESGIWMEIATREMIEYLDQAFGISHRLAIGTFGGAPETDSEYPEEPELAEGTEIHEEWKEAMNE